MKAYAILAAALFVPRHDVCPPHFDIGQNYHEIQSGPCPDIDSVATFKAPDSVHVGYLCRSKNVMVIGDMRNGKMDAFFLYSGE